MATMYTKYTNTTTGTVDTGTTHVTGGTTPSHGWVLSRPVSPPPPPMPKTLKARVPVVKRDFWYGVEWEEHISYMPRKSITGKWIIGKMYWRSRVVTKIEGSTHRQFAKQKELFQEKLKGRA